MQGEKSLLVRCRPTLANRNGTAAIYRVKIAHLRRADRPRRDALVSNPLGQGMAAGQRIPEPRQDRMEIASVL